MSSSNTKGLSLVQSKDQYGKKIISPPPSLSINQISNWLCNCGLYNDDNILSSYFEVLRHEHGILFYKFKSESKCESLDKKYGDKALVVNNLLLTQVEMGEGEKENVNYLTTHDFKTHKTLTCIETDSSLSMKQYKKISTSIEMLRSWCREQNKSCGEEMIYYDSEEESKESDSDMTEDTIDD